MTFVVNHYLNIFLTLFFFMCVINLAVSMQTELIMANNECLLVLKANTASQFAYTIRPK